MSLNKAAFNSTVIPIMLHSISQLWAFKKYLVKYLVIFGNLVTFNQVKEWLFSWEAKERNQPGNRMTK